MGIVSGLCHGDFINHVELRYKCLQGPVAFSVPWGICIAIDRDLSAESLLEWASSAISGRQVPVLGGVIYMCVYVLYITANVLLGQSEKQLFWGRTG